MNDFHISAVIPARNAELVLDRAVNSIVRQSLPVSEIILIDDGSTDSTPDVARAWGDRIRLIQQPRGGVATARNRGITEAKGDWIAFLNVTDEWLPDRLEQQCAVLSKHPELRWGFCNGEIIEPAGIRTFPLDGRARRLLREHGFLPSYFEAWEWRVPCASSGLMVAADALRKVGGFDESLEIAERTDLLWRLAIYWPPFAYVEKPGYRLHREAAPKSAFTGRRTQAVLSSLAKNLELARQECPENLAAFKRIAQQTAFRRLVRAAAGCQDVSPAMVAEHVARFPLPPLQTALLKALQKTPRFLARRLEGPIRDFHRIWHAQH